MKKRVLSMLLVLAMVLTLFPVSAMAADEVSIVTGDTATGTYHVRATNISLDAAGNASITANEASSLAANIMLSEDVETLTITLDLTAKSKNII